MMRRETARRLFALVLSVALTAGLMTGATQATQSSAGTVAMSGDMPMSHACNGCAGSEQAMPSALCGLSFCGIAVLAAAAAIYQPAVAELVEPTDQPSATGHVLPPDPYPPRPAVLG